MDIEKIRRQIEYSKDKTDRLYALFQLPENIIKLNYSDLDIDLIIKTLEEIKQTIGGAQKLRFSFCLSCKAQILLALDFRFSGVFLQGQDRKRLTEGENQSDRGRRQRAKATQHGARLNFSPILGVFSARWYSRQGAKAQTQYKRNLTASRLTA